VGVDDEVEEARLALKKKAPTRTRTTTTAATAIAGVPTAVLLLDNNTT